MASSENGDSSDAHPSPPPFWLPIAVAREPGTPPCSSLHSPARLRSPPADRIDDGRPRSLRRIDLTRHKLFNTTTPALPPPQAEATTQSSTYCLETATHAWTQVGEWTLPFVGKVEYVPELKLWFGICAGDMRLGALVDAWKEFEAPREWTELQVPQLVNLGSGRFCVARFFHAVNIMAFFGLDDSGVEEYFTVLTETDVVPCVHGGTCSDDVDGSSGKVELKMIRHNSRLHMSYCSDGTIKLVF
uniref:Uncharacterized protein n=1 Tax=Setaria viridis TaxID=4556 RepID=A0A4U6W5K3_SETVI|nr:hypothetical protein SEVIR_1G075000v2 [Setaria viridis]